MDNSFGERLRMLIQKQKLTQQELADALDIPRNTVWRWVNNKATPETNKLQKLATLLHVSVDDLLNDQPLDNLEDWILTIRISHDNEEVLNLPRGVIPTACEILTNRTGGYVQLGGRYELWADDDKFSQLIKDLKAIRSSVIQNGKALGCLP